MPFTKGMAKHPQSGKKKGSTHPITRRKTLDILIASGQNPTEEILKLIPFLEPKEQVRAWFELLSYIEPKAKSPDLIEAVVGKTQWLIPREDISDKNPIEITYTFDGFWRPKNSKQVKNNRVKGIFFLKYQEAESQLAVDCFYLNNPAANDDLNPQTRDIPNPLRDRCEEGIQALPPKRISL